MEKDQLLVLLTRLGAPAVVLKRIQLLKFVVSGGTAAFVHMGVMELLTQMLGVWYVIATTVGFGAGFGVSFTLQKYWTFQEKTQTRLPGQAFAFFILQMVNLLLNVLLMVALVDGVGLPTLSSQFVVLLALACSTYLISKRLIFHRVDARNATEK